MDRVKTAVFEDRLAKKKDITAIVGFLDASDNWSSFKLYMCLPVYILKLHGANSAVLLIAFLTLSDLSRTR